MNLQNQIRALLQKEFAPLFIDVTDDSTRHQGHAGARAGGNSHFRIVLVSAHFENVRPLERHRKIYRVLDGLNQQGIHALQMELWTPDEWRARSRTQNSL